MGLFSDVNDSIQFILFDYVSPPDEEKYKNELHAREKDGVEEVCQCRIIYREGETHEL